MRKNYIYALICPLTEQIRYVGKTVDIKNRIRYHFNPNHTDHNTHKKNWINKLKNQNLKPEVLILDTIECLNNEWEIYEKYWISQCKSWGFNLLNYSQGGDNPPIKTSWSIENRLKLIENRKDKKTIKVFYQDEYIGLFNGINTFIREYLKLDRYENKKEFNVWSSKISSIIYKKRNSHKNYKFELVL